MATAQAERRRIGPGWMSRFFAPLRMTSETRRLAGEIDKSRRLQIPVFQHPQRGFEDGSLPSGFLGRVQGIAVAERNEQSSRRVDLEGDLAQELDRDGRDPLPLQLRGEQAHGLAAHRSDRHEESRIHAVPGEQLRGGGRGVADEGARGGQGTHEGEVTTVDLSDPAGFGELPQAIDGKGEVGIAPDSRMIEGPAAMRIHEGLDLDVCRNLPEARISSALASVEGFLPGHHEAGARDQRDSTLRQWLLQRSPWYGVDPPPAVSPQEELDLQRKL